MKKGNLCWFTIFLVSLEPYFKREKQLKNRYKNEKENRYRNEKEKHFYTTGGDAPLRIYDYSSILKHLFLNILLNCSFFISPRFFRIFIILYVYFFSCNFKFECKHHFTRRQSFLQTTMGNSSTKYISIGGGLFSIIY